MPRLVEKKRGNIEKRLLAAAFHAAENAYVLWGLRVGAAVLAEDREVYEGCNVESWVSGLGTCAERCAINHAILHGNRKVKAVAVVMDSNKGEGARPCGACLQYIQDFAENRKIRIIMAHAERKGVLHETVEVKTLAELLPLPYKK